MNFWPFRKASPPAEKTVLHLDPASMADLDQLASPPSSGLPFSEAASVDISVVPRMAPSLQDTGVIEPEALPENPLLRVPPPVLEAAGKQEVLESPGVMLSEFRMLQTSPSLVKLEKLGELYGEAYDVPEELPGKDMVQLAPVLTEKAAEKRPVLRAVQTPAEPRRVPSETPQHESIADALIDYKHQLILDDNRFTNHSINDLVERYFAQSEESHLSSGSRVS